MVSFNSTALISSPRISSYAALLFARQDDRTFAEQKLPSLWKPKFGIRITFAVFLLSIPAIEANRLHESPDPPANLMVQVDAVPVDGRPLKRARLRKEAEDILPFPAGDQGADGESFRHCVRSLIARHARITPMPGVPQLRTWRIAFRIGATIDLEVVEEDVARSRRMHCDHCRIVGWSRNPVCGKRYHFIIRNDNSSSPPYQQQQQQHCSHCGSLCRLPAFRCNSCSHEIPSADLEEWAYRQLEDPTHLLHGLVHSNGYGHLLRINGRESGSKTLTGGDLMEFWDQLCKILCIRKVTVMDVSKKYGMEFRLLHGVASGCSWYGNWGYQFGAGSFAHTAETYQKALNYLATMPLSHFTSHCRTPRTPLEDTISFYTFLSPRKLKTLGDLFGFILKLLEEYYGCQNPPETLPECKWREEDIRKAEGIMIKILRAVKESKWITWRALQRATFSSIGSQKLLDYCLKRLGGRRVGNDSVVAVRCNSESNSVEYRLQPASEKLTSAQSLCKPSKECLLRDLRQLYDSLLNPVTRQRYRLQSVWESTHKAIVELLDCKKFIKHYDKTKDFLTTNPLALQIWCRLELVDKPRDYLAPPPELMALPLNATIAEVKVEVTKAFQETYPILQSFHAEQVWVDGEYVDDGAQISFRRPKGCLQIRGRVGDGSMFEQFRMERGTENWTVDCPCGAKDDDGERMITCDGCGVWKHTRCSGIDDIYEVPTEFICITCGKKPECQSKSRRKK